MSGKIMTQEKVLIRARNAQLTRLEKYAELLNLEVKELRNEKNSFGTELISGKFAQIRDLSLKIVQYANEASAYDNSLGIMRRGYEAGAYDNSLGIRCNANEASAYDNSLGIGPKDY